MAIFYIDVYKIDIIRRRELKKVGQAKQTG